MTFNILRQLQYCTGSDYGDNLNMAPSRIIPISLVEDNDNNKNIISYVPPRLGNEYVICERNKKLPEPSAYFRAPNTFLKSLLYLCSVKYYDNVHLPIKANNVLEHYLKDIFEEMSKNKENTKTKKLTQIILNNSDGIFDTDPNNNPYYTDFIKILLKKQKCNIIIIRSDDYGNYYDTVPNIIPSLSIKNEKEQSEVYYILLQNSNGLFSPYGKAYLKD
jgi:hypothetical protein